MGKYTSAGSVYAITGLTASDLASGVVDFIIAQAEREVDLVTGRLWGPSGTATTPAVREFQDGPSKDIFGIKKTSLLTENYPILAIGSIAFLNPDGSVATFFSGLSWEAIAAGSRQTNEFWVDPEQGKITFISDEIPPGTRNVRIDYIYGYESVPQEIATLTECIAGIRAWVAFLGGKYNYLNSYSIPEQSVSKGDLFQRGQQMIQLLTEEAEKIYARIGKREKSLFFATKGSR